MKNTLNKLLFLACSILIVGCKQDPFPANIETTSASSTTAENTSTTPTVPTVVPVAPHMPDLDAPRTVPMREGTLGTFTVVPRVPKGTPIISVLGLPNGAVFDSATNTFSWTPQAGDGIDPSAPGAYYREYRVQFLISSSIDPLTAVSREVNVIVSSYPQRVEIDNGNVDMVATEGAKSEFRFKLTSPDSPKGPFFFDIIPHLNGATIEADPNDPSIYIFSYTPPYNFVTNRDYGGNNNNFAKEVELRVTASGKRGQLATKIFDMTVVDRRYAPAISFQDNLEFSYSAEFSVVMEDLNGERAPDLTVDRPAFGTVRIKYIDPTNNAGDPEDSEDSEESEESEDLGDIDDQAVPPSSRNPVKIAVVDWIDVPITEYNKPQQLTINSCVNRDRGNRKICTTQVVHMTFVGQTHKAPAIDRSDWSDGEVKNVRVGTTLEIDLDVTDQDNSRVAPTVTIMPVEMQSEVSYQSGLLRVNATTSGTRVFQVVAQSAFGLVTKESFTVRVYSSDWGQNLIMQDGTARDAEIQVTRELLGDSQLLNPSLERVTDESFILRRAVFYTTSIFKAVGSSALWTVNSLAQSIAHSLETVRKVIISTPLLGILPVPALPSDLILAGRFAGRADLNGAPLSSFSVVPTADSVFSAPRRPVRLGQILTSESINPMTFDVRSNGACKIVMNLQSGATNIPVAAECTQEDNSKVLYLGFEIGDLQFSSADMGLGTTWIQAWTSAGGTQ